MTRASQQPNVPFRPYSEAQALQAALGPTHKGKAGWGDDWDAPRRPCSLPSVEIIAGAPPELLGRPNDLYELGGLDEGRSLGLLALDCEDAEARDARRRQEHEALRRPALPAEEEVDPWGRKKNRKLEDEKKKEAEVEVPIPDVEESDEELMAKRCQVERGRPALPWSPIGMDHVTNNHEKIMPGMLYRLDFPWDGAGMKKMGPKWLTKAFHTTGVLDPRNAVTKVRIAESVTRGNNSAKFMFEVEYKKKTKDLHTRLFAKCPFGMKPQTRSDRLSSSVYKQPMDLYEINTYRLLEDRLPCKTPKYYFGDISNESSNFIIITGCIPFAEMDGVNKAKKLKPFEIEGPYDKAKDWQLRGDLKEYYMLIMERAGELAGYYKAGKLVEEEMVNVSIQGMRAPGDRPDLWGVNPMGSSGEDLVSVKRLLDGAIVFISQTAKVVFPDYVTTDAFKAKFTRCMMKYQAYSAELEYWKVVDPDYCAIGHQNLNADNAYFWRDDKGALDCGVFDWGGFGISGLGRKVWWVFNCTDFENIKDNIDEYMLKFMSSYKAHGGPKIDLETLRLAVFMEALSNCYFMIKAVPNCTKSCKKETWALIKDRHDPRIAGDVEGKSTLRTTWHVLGNIVRMMEEMDLEKYLDAWIQDFWVEKFGQSPKTDQMIFGT